jgi:uncharacterized protein YabN with tetrapyrrole methylase and pyrophosphatase domain
LYSEGSLRTENYDRAAEAILKAASNGRTIGYVTYGNPMAYDRVAQNLVSHAQGSGLEIEVVPGISSIDTIFCDLQIDVAPGVQIYEASWLVACQVLPRVDFPLLLLQIGTFGSLRTHYATRQDGSSLTELIEHLCKVYPRAQEISVVRSTGHEDRPARVRYVSLKNLSTVTAEDLSGASLYIPALERPHLNDQIVSEMTHN